MNRPLYARVPSLGTWVALVVTALLAPSTTLAQGLSTPTVGTGESTAATADPTAVYFNPAMTAFNRGTQVLLGGALIAGDIRYRRDYRAVYQRSDSFDFATPIDPSAVDQSKNGFADEVRTNPIALAPQAFLTTHLGDERLVGGFGIYAPYAAILDFPANGPQRFQLQQATIATVFFTPTIAYRVHDRFSIGVGASYVLGFAELSRVQDFATVSDVGTALANPPISQANDFGANASPAVRELDVMARPIVLRRMFGHGVTFHAGVAAEPVDGLRLGLTYQHRTKMNFNGVFGLDMDDDFFTQDLASQGLQYAPRVNGDATLSFTLPSILRFAASYDITENVGLAVDVAYTFWSVVESFRVRVQSPGLAQPEIGIPDTSEINLRRDWHNTLGIDGVLRLTLPSGKVRFWGRAGFRQSAVPDRTIDVASPDGNRIVGGLGGIVQVTESVSLLGDLGVQAVLKRTVVASDYDLGNGEYRLLLFSAGLGLVLHL